MSKFKPTLAVDASNELDRIKYPKLGSFKIDGIRGIFHPTLGNVSRSLKPIQNKQLRDKYQYVLGDTKQTGRIRDGEFYKHGLSFQVITKLVMTKDFMDVKTIKKNLKENTEIVKYYKFQELDDTGKVIDSLGTGTGNVVGFDNPLEYHCFDTFDENKPNESFQQRHDQIYGSSNLVKVDQVLLYCKQDVLEMFDRALSEGYEGLMLRDPTGPYKCGRATMREEFLLKVKPFESFDAKILGVVQATKVDPSAERTVNELGRHVTSKKKDDRILIEKASAFWVEYNGLRLKVVLAMTDTEKELVWRDRSSFIGKMIEYKGMLIGAKDVPRHPVFERFREDRD